MVAAPLDPLHRLRRRRARVLTRRRAVMALWRKKVLFLESRYQPPPPLAAKDRSQCLLANVRVWMLLVAAVVHVYLVCPCCFVFSPPHRRQIQFLSFLRMVQVRYVRAEVRS
ncbi:hypothetical protein VPH35_111453 [Triticum aestivum]